jgi:hypothetical protein
MSSRRSVVPDNDNNDTKGSKPYVVGYGKPPVHTRFKKGQSGNPNGRRKGAKNFSTALKETLQEKVVIKENGKSKAVSKQEVITKQLVNKAASGELRAIYIIASLRVDTEENSATAAEPTSLNEQDRKLILSLLKQYAPSTNE